MIDTKEANSIFHFERLVAGAEKMGLNVSVTSSRFIVQRGAAIIFNCYTMEKLDGFLSGWMVRESLADEQS